MKKHYVLVDYENVAIKSVDLLKPEHFQLVVFLGPNNVRLPVSLVVGMQEMGLRAKYIVMTTPGDNALDFQLAYYLGTMVNSDPESNFSIISKDKGFDPLVMHLLEKNVSISRYCAIHDMLGVENPELAVIKATPLAEAAPVAVGSETASAQEKKPTAKKPVAKKPAAAKTKPEQPAVLQPAEAKTVTARQAPREIDPVAAQPAAKQSAAKPTSDKKTVSMVLPPMAEVSKAPAKNMHELVTLVITHLIRQKDKRPVTQPRLLNAIKTSLFTKYGLEVAMDNMEEVYDWLVKLNYIAVDGDVVSYAKTLTLPEASSFWSSAATQAA